MIYSQPRTFKRALQIIEAQQKDIEVLLEATQRIPTYYDDEYRFHEYELQFLRDVLTYCLKEEWFKRRLPEIRENIKLLK